MPHKNKRCPKCGRKMRHHRWIREYTEWGKDRFHRGEYWLREVKCPGCGYVKNDIMMRRESDLKRIRESNKSKGETKYDEVSMNAKEFRREVGREIRRVHNLQKEHWVNGRRYYLRVLRATYDILGIGVEEIRIIQSNPKLWEETKIYLQGIVDWCEFLLTIQPRERQNRKKADIEFTVEKVEPIIKHSVRKEK